MKHLHYLIITILALLSLVACRDELDMHSGNNLSGKVRIELTHSAVSVVQSRAMVYEPQETVGNVTVFIFDKNGIKKDGFTQSAPGNIEYIDVYLTPADDQVYVIANYPDPDKLEKEVTSLDVLKQQTHIIDMPDGAYSGHYVLTGSEKVATLLDPQHKKVIQLKRLAAHLDITLKVDTSPAPQPGNQEQPEGNNPSDPDTLVLGGDRGSFKLSAMYLCQVPKGSYLLERERTDSPDKHIEHINESDYVFDPNPDQMRANFFPSIRLDVKEDSHGTITASFDLFENRRGEIDDDLKFWPELTEFVHHPLINTFCQLYKRPRAMDYPKHIGKISMKDNQKQDLPNDALDKLSEVKEGKFYNATYLRIDGLYRASNGVSHQTSYYVYLGEDSYRNYDIKRNHWYNHQITIRSLDNFDHRVTDEPLDGLTLLAPDAEEDLDAHFNVIKALLYAPSNWKVMVENPDETPWLEVSTSAKYQPQLLGVPATGKEATFSLSGDEGLHYFYIHTDEYIPNIKSPAENKNTHKRTGKIVCRCGKQEKVISITQLPAQLVIFEDNYDVHTMKPVYDAFFIENKLEQKYMPWGFFHYWSYVTDDLIVAGTWDGLANTRRLYEVGLHGDHNEIINDYVEPAYPDGLPYDHALGYIISKNRDRNGNGQIDYNEITWYWPAIKEIQQIATEYRQNNVELQTPMGKYHTSTPSSADPIGITAGFSYVITLPEGKRRIEQRDRYYHVIACRRMDAWKGPQDGAGNGDVTTAPNWGTDNEIIIPRQ